MIGQQQTVMLCEVQHQGNKQQTKACLTIPLFCHSGLQSKHIRRKDTDLRNPNGTIQNTRRPEGKGELLCSWLDSIFASTLLICIDVYLEYLNHYASFKRIIKFFLEKQWKTP